MFAAGQQSIDAAKAKVTNEVGIGRAHAGGFALNAKLTVRIPGIELSAAKQLTKAAHPVCPYSKATRGNVPVELTVV
jgi:osmotically inducible protein OsmC